MHFDELYRSPRKKIFHWSDREESHFTPNLSANSLKMHCFLREETKGVEDQCSAESATGPLAMKTPRDDELRNPVKKYQKMNRLSENDRSNTYLSPPHVVGP